MVQEIRTLSFPALVSFATVVRTGGITAAARELGLAKSAVSRHIAQLEDRYDIRLFERGARSIRLTLAGRHLHDRVASLLGEAQMLDEVARSESGAITGPVRMTSTVDFGTVLARELLPRIRRRHPGISVILRPSYDFEDLQDPGIDIAVRVGNIADDRLVVRPVGSFRRVLVASPDIAAAHAVETPQDLAHVPCLVFRGDSTSATWRFAAPQPVQVQVSGPLAVRSFPALLGLAIDGHGFAFLPEFTARSALAEGQLVRILPDATPPDTPVYLTYRPGVRRISRVAAALDIAAEVIPDLLAP